MRKPNPARTEAMRKMAEGGATLDEIGKAFGITTSAVCHHFKKKGIIVKSKREERMKIRNETRKKTAIELHAKRIPIRRICKEMKLTRQTVMKFLDGRHDPISICADDLKYIILEERRTSCASA